jgi:hypothetical protein
MQNKSSATQKIRSITSVLSYRTEVFLNLEFLNRYVQGVAENPDWQVFLLHPVLVIRG